MLVDRQAPLFLSLLTLQGLHCYCKAAALGMALLHACPVPALTQPHGCLKVNPPHMTTPSQTHVYS